ncbi:MAG TPA: RNB domain-containing ribonuclease [Terriglobales bacterium]|jgi:ribonuclease R|nr:RNB domain-containing ribonuclease [Terriglobales bacterium]
MLSDAAILKKIERQPKRTAGFKQMVRELGVRGDARRELSERLQNLVASGQLQQVDSDRYAIPQPAAGKNMAVGRLSMHRDGFGFVIPEAGSLDERLKARLAGDIFIPPPAIGSAMHGDRVLVEIGNIRPDGRAEGRILRLIGRAHSTVVGKFHYGSRRNYVTPIDQKITQEIIIPPGMEYPEDSDAGASVPAGVGRGTEDSRGILQKNETHLPAPHERGRSRPPSGEGRHRVLGAEAARRADWDDLENVVVDVEITDWPTATQNPRGRVVEILGYEDDFGADVEIIIRKFHLPHRFPPAVLEEAQSAESIIPAAEVRKRRDFRGVQIVTIDGETARDFDDAVAVRRMENGNFELQVHIADVAHYVTPDSALDQEARLRGTSVYFPDRAVPMLPLELSADICSLRPQLDRLVMSCVMEIDPRGEILGCELSEGIIRSAERMTYTDVNAVLAGDPGARQRYAKLVPAFELMRDLALILNRKRERRGSIDFDLPEPVIEFDEFGLMKSITRSERNIAHRLIEEFMLSANESVASYLETRRIASLYRIHEKPDAKRVYDFEVIAATFGYSLGVGPLPIQRVQPKTDRRAHYGTGKRPREIEIPKEVHITPRMYQKLTEKIAGKPEERILSFLMLRSLKQARYSEENLGHFALAATSYTHFTSPIRRYPDLIVHRILKDVLRDESEGSAGVPPARSRTERALEQAHLQDAGATPWSKRRDHSAHREVVRPAGGPIPLEELHEIAEESSQSERRADDAERELMEWKKVKFMQDRVGEEFDGLIISVTKYGLFVELTDLFVEGLVPLDTLTDDRYTYHENTREIIGQRSRRIYSLGQRVRVLVDRIDPVEKKIQFALLEEKPVPKRKNR